MPRKQHSINYGLGPDRELVVDITRHVPCLKR